jgi:hypothetical protein
MNQKRMNIPLEIWLQKYLRVLAREEKEWLKKTELKQKEFFLFWSFYQYRVSN